MNNSLYTTEDIVKKALTLFEDARSDDFVLIYRTYQLINENAVIREPFHHVMLHHKEYGFPPFESITRARRKLQNTYPELANEKTKEKRLNKTADYIDYAIGGYKNTFSSFVDSQK